jgi:Predicted P-loop ATPase
MISPDLPITKFEDDTLNRGSFAQSLAKVLLQYSHSSSFSIGLYGEWGSGKTSLLNMVLGIVEKSDKNIVILRFNPWLCSDPKQLTNQFFKQMATAIKLKKPAAAQAWELIDQYADIFDAASFIPVAGPFVTIAGKILTKRAKKQSEQPVNDLQDIKNKIIEKMKEENLKIIVSIDDIDRLSEEEIIAVFQLVKALADFPKTIYLLAFDYDVVVKALGKVQHGDGKEYLEKVIQVPFEIPAPSIPSIHDALFSKLNTILGDISEDRLDKATWAELFQFGLKQYIKSIRDVIRYTNVFSLKYELLKNETDIVDLLGITCLQVFESAIYSKLPNLKDILCGATSSYSYESQKAEEEKIQKAIHVLIVDGEVTVNIEATKNILGILFPKTRSTTGISYSMGRNYMHRDFLINNNIAVSACFDRYFSLSLENEAIPTGIIKRLIYEADEIEFCDGIRQIYDEGKIVRFLEAIEAYANKNASVNISAERASLILMSLSRYWGFFNVEDKDFFSIPFEWRFLFCVEPLLKSMDESARYSSLRAVFEDSEVHPSTLALLLNDFETQLGRFSDEASVKDKPIITLEKVLELEEIFKRRALETLESETALEKYNGLNFLWILEQIDPELTASKKKAIITDEISLVKVLSYCTLHGMVSGRTTSKTWQVDLKTIEEFIDVDEAYRRIQTFVTTNNFLSLPEDEQMDIAAFLLTMEKKPENEIIKNRIVKESIQKELHKLVSNIHCIAEQDPNSPIEQHEKYPARD